MDIENKQIHVWSFNLSLTDSQINKRYALLTLEERARADQFHQSIHRQRFIAARSQLRLLLSGYVNVPPEKIIFGYTKYKKPYLLAPEDQALRFNLSHSHDMAIYAITLNADIGVDIEKSQSTYEHAIAKRYFSQREYHALLQIPITYRPEGFYRLWARKEALVKAIGQGLSLSLSSFSVSPYPVDETIVFCDQNWSIVSLSIHADYQAALATNQAISKESIRYFLDHIDEFDSTIC